MKLLIPLDGSKFAEEALGPASDLATRSGGEVHLLEIVKELKVHSTWINSRPMEHIFMGEYDWPRGIPMGSPEHPLEMGVPVETAAQAVERTCSATKEYLDSVTRRYFHGDAKTKVMVGEGWAEEMDVVAMATHGCTGLAKLLLGSVAAKLLRARAAPLFLVRPDKLHEGE